ncbi:hypothetical protein GUJ93_ZPchr0002g22973 [Zizania palustris]|uniref:Uncharacterized protein n=1 Tax=Zizania palustris TaxID=103762 RepID=A0A8J5SES8_ZIZPA|nr:hypothetical protein GUJ93_ZPchr0002g22973 [Zizania palustris]
MEGRMKPRWEANTSFLDYGRQAREEAARAEAGGRGGEWKRKRKKNVTWHPAASFAPINQPIERPQPTVTPIQPIGHSQASNRIHHPSFSGEPEF